MKKTLKTEEILKSYDLLKDVNYQKLEDADKVKTWKIVRLLKPVATQYEETRQDAVKSLIPENFNTNLQKAQEYERQKQAGSAELSMTEEEYKAFLAEFQKYNTLLSDALKEHLDKEHELEFEPLSEDVLGLLVVTNNWSLAQTDVLEWMIG